MPNGRAVVGGLLMAIAALAAFWLATSGDGGDRVEVVVADRDLRVGDVVTEADVRLVSVDIDGEVGGLYGSTSAVVGRVVISPTNAGEFLLASSTSESVEDRVDSFELTVAVDPERVPGNLTPGETVDVFSTWNSGLTELIAVDAVVIDVARSDDGLIGRGDLRVRLQLADLNQTEATVHAHSAGDLTLVRSPNDSGAEVGRQYRPGEDQSSATGDETEEGD